MMSTPTVFTPEAIEIRTASGGLFSLPLFPCRLEFAHRTLDRFAVESDTVCGNRRTLRGSAAGTPIRFEAEWTADPGGWLRLETRFLGRPAEEWGSLDRVFLLGREFPGAAFQPPLGWREIASPEEAAAVAERPPEEGGGLLPRYGYPLFGPGFFLGLEHPMACIENDGARALLFHHPVWEGETLCAMPLVIGIAEAGETVESAFLRYFETIRLPKPDRAMVEINTFWTDAFESASASYGTDLPSYERIAREWSQRILGNERGLVSHLLLDAGWYEPASLYRPTAVNGGPGDGALARLGRRINELGFQFGLWFSLNGPIGTEMKWAAAQGYRTSSEGCGSGYSSANGKLTYTCLTDRRWEEDLARRLEELIGETPVAFFKGDWDNDAVEDPQWDAAAPHHRERLREAIANAMIRIYGRMHARRPGVALRGGWWPSPWWFAHVDNTHLPNSGDHEAADLPSLTQRDAGLTCRDAVYHHVMVKSRTPVPFDVICGHEFASSLRNPVQDTEESWMNNLAVWVSRGSHYIQLYLAPYHVHGWKAGSLREMLRWFRAHEALLWKAPTQMLGGEPFRGEVYGYHHGDGGREIVTLRNPLARPQPFPGLAALGLSGTGWTEVYPFCRRFEADARPLLGSHEVVILTRGLQPAPPRASLNTPDGRRLPAFAATNRELHGEDEAIPEPHDLGLVRAEVFRLGSRKIAFHVTLPPTVESAEIVLQVRTRDAVAPAVRAAVGRYPDGVAAFPVAVTLCRSNPQIGFSQRRLRVPPCDPAVAILRFPLGTGGKVHGFLSADEELPEIEGAWLEGTFWNLPAPTAEEPAVLLPPAPAHPRQALLDLTPLLGA